MSDDERTRTYSWADPLAMAERGHDMDGLDYLRRVLTGEIPKPPIAATLDFALVEVERGRAVFEAVPREYHYNPIGVVHGGLAATLLDSAMGCAVHSVMPAGLAYTTLEIKVNYIRALTSATGPVRAEGTVVHAGKRTAVAEGRVTDAGGAVYATASTTCIILRP